MINGRRPEPVLYHCTMATLRDLVSYDGKHNEANGEDN